MRAAVLGSPIGHSLSPVLHRAAYAALGLDWTYDAVECTEADLPGVLAQGWDGLSLTMPLKTAVLPLLVGLSPLAAATASANTLVPREQGWYGDNTDVHGIVAALGEAGGPPGGGPAGGRSVVIGGGATARSALAAMVELGVSDVCLLVRSEPVEALACAARLGLQVEVSREAAALEGADLVVSTVPAGAADPWAAAVAEVPLLLDVVYAPWPTAIASACRGTVVGGGAMLLHQAARQVELMTGCVAPVEEMRAALSAQLTDNNLPLSAMSGHVLTPERVQEEGRCRSRWGPTA